MNLGFFNLNAQTAGSGATFWMPEAVSNHAARVDSLFYFIYYVSIIFFILVVAAMIHFCIKYRRRSNNDKTSPLKGSHTLELAWSVIPAILLVITFAWSFRDWIALSNVPDDNTLDVRVMGQKWTWNFTYPRENIRNTPDLVVPVNRNVKLIMSSTDVLHSFFVPELRIKRDVLPRRYTVLWFNATQTGEWPIYCAEYCGTDHSRMLRTIKVVTPEEYEEWVASGGGIDRSSLTSEEYGAMLFDSRGCNGCHSVDGSQRVGPTMLGLHGSQRSFADGTTAVADDNYLRESIVDPNAKVVQGFSPVMPTYRGQLSDEDLNALIDYIKSLSQQ